MNRLPNILNNYETINLKINEKINWNITFEKNIEVFDESIVDKNQFYKTYDKINFFTTIDSELINSRYGDIYNFFSQKTYLKVGKYLQKKFDYNFKDDNLKIIPFPFLSVTGLKIYYIINKYHLINKKDKILIISKNVNILDGILYYLNYRLFGDKKDILFLLYSFNTHIRDNVDDYLTKKKINYNNISVSLNNDNLIMIQKQIDDKFNFIAIDLITVIRKLRDPILYNMRCNYFIHPVISFIILSLNKLNKNGNLVISVPILCNKMLINFFMCLGSYFNECFIDDTIGINYSIILYNIIFKNYKGSYDKNEFIELNKKMYEFDEMGGFNFKLTNNEEIKLFGNFPGNIYPEKYLSSIININNSNNLDKIYDSMRIFHTNKLNEIIHYYSTIYNYNLNKNNSNLLKNIYNLSKSEAIIFAQKHKLPLKEWSNINEIIFYKNTIKTNFTNMSFSFIQFFNQVDAIDTNIFQKIQIKNIEVLEKTWQLSEFAYSYVEKVDYDKYKGIELFFNNRYKELNKLLYNRHKININGKSVSRAWIKMYELIHDTNFIFNFKDQKQIKGFFICEAPGNFINSMDHYIKTKTDIKHFIWNAQSLAEGKSDIYDFYGFINKTYNKWDFGPDKNGDITSTNNLKHYIEKYKGADFLIGDCGMEFSPDKDISKDISIFQLIYALLIPRLGGNFVIKTYSTNYNKQYLSLLYVICSCYEKVYTFKSQTNFWSPEVYIVGINNKGTKENIILQIAENLSNKKILYPIDIIPEEFTINYQKNMYNIVNLFTTIKKFFVFLAENQELFNKNKKMLNDIIKNKNYKWMDTYLKRDGIEDKQHGEQVLDITFTADHYLTQFKKLKRRYKKLKLQKGGSMTTGFVLHSSDFYNHGDLPIQFTGEGTNISPNLFWTNTPPNTKSFALIVEDLDNLDIHWLVWNIDKNITSLPQNFQIGDSKQIRGIHYKGPKDIQIREPHRISYKLYALNNFININKADKDILMNYITGYYIDHAELIGIFEMD